ncbi:unnamed protein product [Ectocarpus sp. 12 AP-2014]
MLTVVPCDIHSVWGTSTLPRHSTSNVPPVQLMALANSIASAVSSTSHSLERSGAQAVVFVTHSVVLKDGSRQSKRPRHINCPGWHEHSQQSPPSYPHSALLLSGMHRPLPMLGGYPVQFSKPG